MMFNNSLIAETGSDLLPVAEEVVLKHFFTGVFVIQHLSVEGGDLLRSRTEFHQLT